MSSLKAIIYNMVVVKRTIPCLLMCRGEILSDSKMVGEYPSVMGGERLIIQRAPVPVSFEHHGGQFKTFVAQVFLLFALLQCFAGNEVDIGSFELL